MNKPKEDTSEIKVKLDESQMKEILTKCEEEKLNSLQQLKAKISAIADSLQSQVDGGMNGLDVFWTIRELRKLSAI